MANKVKVCWINVTFIVVFPRVLCYCVHLATAIIYNFKYPGSTGRYGFPVFYKENWQLAIKCESVY